MVLSNMEREVLKVFVEAYIKTKDPNCIVKLTDVKYPKMNGPQKLEIHKALRKKGAFHSEEGENDCGLRPTERLTSAALNYFNFSRSLL